MGKTANSIKLLIILSDGVVHKIKDLADELETNPRNIIEYRTELQEAGYCIIGVPGKYGGYQLDKRTIFPCLKLTDAENKALADGYGYLNARNDFPEKEDYTSAMEKVFSSATREVRVDMPTVIPRFPLAMSEEDINERYQIMNTAIITHNKVEIEYRSNDNILRNRVVRPYKMYMYNNGWFVLAYCEMANDFRYFKLNRITKYQVLQEKFKRSKFTFNEKDWLDKYGMTNNGEWYDVKLKFTGKFAMVVQDYNYGKNQITECVDSNTTILTLQMQYRDNIIGFVLSHGIYCEVLEPEWLKKEVLEMAKKVVENNKE